MDELTEGQVGGSEFDEFDISADSFTDLDDVDLSNFGEVDTTVGFPHVKVPTKAFQEFLRIAKLFSAASGRDIISKSVSFLVEEGKVGL